MKILEIFEQRIEKVKKHLNKEKQIMDITKGKDKLVMEREVIIIESDTSCDHNPFQATSDESSDHNPFQATSDESSDHNHFQVISDDTLKSSSEDTWYSTQSKAYRVYNKRTRVIVETIHVNFDELPQMASDHSQENVHQAAETVTTSNELDLLFSPMFDELLYGTTQVVSKSSAVTTADAPNQRQQQHTTPSTLTTMSFNRTLVRVDIIEELVIRLQLFLEKPSIPLAPNIITCSIK
ncbi:hypothetical protein Tco_0459608 [Tanacetum coccineum]